MAGDVKVETTDPSKNGMDYAEHERTYEMFLTITKWGIVFVATVLILMAIFLTGPETPPTAQ
jgi:hypothetical protein